MSSYKSGHICVLGDGFPGARHCDFYDCDQPIFAKVPSEHVVQYYVYMDILIVGSIYVTQSMFSGADLLHSNTNPDCYKPARKRYERAIES